LERRHARRRLGSAAAHEHAAGDRDDDGQSGPWPGVPEERRSVPGAIARQIAIGNGRPFNSTGGVHLHR
ncbi:MAG: hypothetical protein M3Q66_03160, partial [Chloroflexota bacterium]|nr:hypothetical protein [Chloroflexota bacterium]